VGSEWPAPAKLNLFLHVVGRRADGYHLLQTVFRFLDYGDTLRCEPRTDGAIVRVDPLPGVPPEADLVVRAALALRAARCRRRRHPASREALAHGRRPRRRQFGCGDDAAGAQSPVGHRPRLAAIAADRPRPGRRCAHLHVHGHTAFAEGVGERFTDLALPPAWYLVLVPAVAVPTPEIFRSTQLRRDTPAILAGDWRPGFGHNDLEPVACALYPEVTRHLEWLRQYGDARMSGSGACCFVAFGTEAAARTAMAALPADMRGFVAAGMDRHPLAMI
jgi:4-diphosphocytidyl-2-C-methyl-D-erythritol kinase